jgi:hypothetical protein
VNTNVRFFQCCTVAFYQFSGVAFVLELIQKQVPEKPAGSTGWLGTSKPSGTVIEPLIIRKPKKLVPD